MIELIDKDSLYWFYSTIAQTYIALIALVGIVVILKVQGLEARIKVIFDTNIGTNYGRPVTVFSNLYKYFETCISIAVTKTNEPIIDLYQLINATDCPTAISSNPEYFKRYHDVVKLGGIVQIIYSGYKRLCVMVFILIFAAILMLVLIPILTISDTCTIAIVLISIIYCFVVLCFAYLNISDLFTISTKPDHEIIAIKEKHIRYILENMKSEQSSE